MRVTIAPIFLCSQCLGSTSRQAQQGPAIQAALPQPKTVHIPMRLIVCILTWLKTQAWIESGKMCNDSVVICTTRVTLNCGCRLEHNYALPFTGA
jgi:hypothetical protein